MTDTEIAKIPHSTPTVKVTTELTTDIMTAEWFRRRGSEPDQQSRPESIPIALDISSPTAHDFPS